MAAEISARVVMRRSRVAVTYATIVRSNKEDVALSWIFKQQHGFNHPLQFRLPPCLALQGEPSALDAPHANPEPLDEAPHWQTGTLGNT